MCFLLMASGAYFPLKIAIILVTALHFFLRQIYFIKKLESNFLLKGNYRNVAHNHGKNRERGLQKVAVLGQGL